MLAERITLPHFAVSPAINLPKSAGEPGSTVPLSSAKYPTALQHAVSTAVLNDPIHIWLYTNPRIFAYSPKVTGIPYDLVQQRWEGVRVGS